MQWSSSRSSHESISAPQMVYIQSLIMCRKINLRRKRPRTMERPKRRSSRVCRKFDRRLIEKIIWLITLSWHGFYIPIMPSASRKKWPLARLSPGPPCRETPWHRAMRVLVPGELSRASAASCPSVELSLSLDMKPIELLCSVKTAPAAVRAC